MELVLPHSAIHNLSESMVLGDYVLYWVGDPMRPETHEKSTLCDIYIVAWKEGWVSEVCICPTLMPTKIELNLFY